MESVGLDIKKIFKDTELIFTIFLELSKLTTLPSEDVRPSKDVNVPTTS